jgi:hypothetical protein
MSIPLATTKITVLRSPASSDFDEPYSGDSDAQRTASAEHVRAVIDRPTGSAEIAGGQQNVIDYGLKCDLVDLSYLDHIRDETTGRTFRIVWFLAYPEHVEAGIRDVEGEV